MELVILFDVALETVVTVSHSGNGQYFIIDDLLGVFGDNSGINVSFYP